MHRTFWLFLAVAMGVALSAHGAWNPATRPDLHTVVTGGKTYPNNGYSVMCMLCHERNPGLTGSPTVPVDNAGSHFVWGPDNTTGNTGIEKITQWSDTGSLSKYGKIGDVVSVTGAAGEMICESCHVMKNGVGESRLLAFDNTDSPRSDLCEGCHANAGTAHHPVTGGWSSVHNRAIATAASGAILNPPRQPATSEVTYPAVQNGINCRSCHKPHNAWTQAGARILKRGYRSPGSAAQGTPVQGNAGSDGLKRQSDMTGNPVPRLVTDFTPLCDACHTASD